MASEPSNQDERAEAEAYAWIEKLESGVLPLAERRAFEAWLDAADNRRVYESMRAIWDGIIPAVAPDPEARRAVLEETHRNAARIRAKNRLKRAGPIAASAAALIALVFAPVPDWPAQADASYATLAEESPVLTLPDASSMTLSPLAQAETHFSARERRVVLRSGAAFFDVASDPRRPFVVETPFGEVRAVGTVFAVRVTEDEACISIIDGVLEARAKGGRSLWSRFTQRERLILAAQDQDVRLQSGAAELETPDPRTRDHRLAWREGRIALSNVSLREAADEVTRFSGVAFEISDPRLARERITLFLDGGDVQGFISLIETSLGARAEESAPGQWVLHR